MIFSGNPYGLRRVAVLCGRRDSVYLQIPGVDVFCSRRDARTFDGSCPCVTHPPCRHWGKLKHFAAKSAGRENERNLARFCADRVRRFGGVLEHPAFSELWTDQGFPRPGCETKDGCTVSFPQFWFGHRGRKDTWIFVSGLRLVDLPPLPYRLETSDRVDVASMSTAEREHTPPDLARWLVDVAILSGRVDRFPLDLTPFDLEALNCPRAKTKEAPEPRLKEPAGAKLKGAICPGSQVQDVFSF